MTNLLDMSMNPAQYVDIPMSGNNPLDQATKAATLRDLTLTNTIRQNQAQISNADTSDTMATRSAIAANTRTDPTTGQPSTDLDGAVRSLSQTSPTAALNLQISMTQRRTELAEKQAELTGKTLTNSLSQVNLGGAMMRGVYAGDDMAAGQANLDRLRANAPSLGLDPAKIPTTYDPAQVQQSMKQATSAGEMLTNKIETARLGLANTKQTKELQQMDATATNEITGQYKDDPNTKEYVQLANTYQTFKSMQATPEFSKGLKDRDLLYNFQNIINPNRSATGGTIEQDEEARSTLGGIGVDFNKVINGGSLTPAQRQQISSFVEGKFADASMNQQVVYNNAQKRLINMRSQGREVDPVNSLPEYGATVDDGQGGKKWVGVHNVMSDYNTQSNAQPADTTSSGIKLSGNSTDPDANGGAAPTKQQTVDAAAAMSPQVTAGKLSVQSPKGNPNKVAPPPSAGKFMTRADITATAIKSGRTEAQIEQLAKAKGYTVE